MISRFLVFSRCFFLLLVAMCLGGLASAARSQAAWENKPVLALYLLDPTSAARLKTDLGLTSGQLEHLVQIAQDEDTQLQSLEARSQAVIGNLQLNLEQKRQWVAESGYNRHIQDILQTDQKRLQETLGRDLYQRLAGWLEQRWAADSQPPAQIRFVRKVLASLSGRMAKTYPRSFEVYATRYEAGDRKIVALPDKCLKFANGGSMACDGYAFGQGYSVVISYQGNFTSALVGEAGPWNIDDNYWSKSTDPQPRRMFADLPVGVPEAQAAFFNGYNGGLDQFGRQVISPVAIDISKALAGDLGLPGGNNKVTVSFMWTEGWDQAQTGSGSGGTVSAPPASITWKTATPNPDGSVVHTIQAGQTLIGIATVYKVELNELLKLNGLTMQSVIQPGDKILVKAATATPTPTVTETLTPEPATLTATTTPSPTPTKEITTPTTIVSATSTTQAAAPGKPVTDTILLVIAAFALVGAGLLIWGVLAQRHTSKH
jgi:LysM repeat protein